MKQFFKTFFASLLALIIFSLIGLVIIASIAASFSKEEQKITPANSVLVIDIAENFEEQIKSDAFSEILRQKKGKSPSLSQLIGLIQHAKKDTAIKGIYIKCAQNPNGYAASEEIRTALLDFRNSNKFIIAYGETITQKGYWLANVANQIYTHPQGGLEFAGFSYETLFLKGLLDKLEIKPQVFYAGKFKSATEPFRYAQMSDANKLQTSVWLNALYSSFIQSIADTRGIEVGTLKTIANEGKIQSANDALENNLVDGLLYDDQVKKLIAKKISVFKQEDISFVSINDYAATVALRGSGNGKIAIIYADGDIEMGKGSNGTIASDEYRILLEKIKNDESIDAVVLRVNSPGGSALASDIIWREIELLKKEKPVVVSMGNYAASGGYYIACGADSILADANTITGSIGVFSVIPNIEGFMKNKLGITFDRVKTGQYADIPSATRTMNATEERFMQAGVDSVYHSFKSRVAKGRKKSIEYIDSIAQGRVWIGSDAVKVGLVDKIGNLNDALATAARMAKLKGYSTKSYPESKSFIEDLISGYEDNIKTKSIKEEIGETQWQILQQVKKVKQIMGQTQARLPIFELNHP
ncbi:MAG: signal peptide peptidase SppA [Chitinophagia bacterium]|jgi:protease-4|nr:signal peptide peptidase SppA [Chitinophagia bacterium]NCA29446.1 signal peptide peptidase SppA [Chitinophagia bacterium]